MAVTLGILPWAGMELNYLNIIMIPVLFGVSVDGGAHMVTRMASGHRLADVVDDTGRAVCGSLLTTAFGFGAMMLAEHPGLNSLGELAVVGLAVNLLVTIVALPALLAWKPQLIANAERP
ncbi:MAG: MMPL family transporter [Deltaproteobacteria bacterium]|nr:MMPL family transporter [Deltaproteobacteria bacterium]